MLKICTRGGERGGGRAGEREEKEERGRKEWRAEGEEEGRHPGTVSNCDSILEAAKFSQQQALVPLLSQARTVHLPCSSHGGT